MKLKRRASFYLQLLLSVVFAFWGAVIFIEKGASRDGVVVLDGLTAQIFGFGLFIIGVYSSLYLLFKAENEEKRREGFSELKDIEINQNGCSVVFKIENKFVFAGKSFIPSFAYTITVPLSEFTPEDLDIRALTFLDLFFRRSLQSESIRVANIHASTSNGAYLHGLGDSGVLKSFNEFMKNKEAIRVKRGRLFFKSGRLRYIEGPYNDSMRLFSPHQGRIEVIASEMIAIAEEIKEVSKPSIQETLDARS